jgi:hypothetical protein
VEQRYAVIWLLCAIDAKNNTGNNEYHLSSPAVSSDACDLDSYIHYRNLLKKKNKAERERETRAHENGITTLISTNRTRKNFDWLKVFDVIEIYDRREKTE